MSNVTPQAPEERAPHIRVSLEPIQEPIRIDAGALPGLPRLDLSAPCSIDREAPLLASSVRRIRDEIQDLLRAIKQIETEIDRRKADDLEPDGLHWLGELQRRLQQTSSVFVPFCSVSAAARESAVAAAALHQAILTRSKERARRAEAARLAAEAQAEIDRAEAAEAARLRRILEKHPA